jgi:hypothetical protein
VACAKGEFTLSLNIQEESQEEIESVLWNIGYWGQASSFATCTSVNNQAPKPGEVAAPMPELAAYSMIRRYYCCFMTNFSRTEVDWSELLTDHKKDSFIIKRLYIWPMVYEERGGSLYLTRTNLVSTTS